MCDTMQGNASFLLLLHCTTPYAFKIILIAGDKNSMHLFLRSEMLSSVRKEKKGVEHTKRKKKRKRTRGRCATVA